jgi:hypothetical protein
VSDPVNAARARIAYHSRRDVGDPAKIPAARREFAIAKLQRTVEQIAELTDEERARLLAALPAA